MMQTIKIISLVIFGGFLLLIGPYLFKSDVNLDLKVFHLPLSETHTIVGYRHNDDDTDDAIEGFSYLFYVKDNEEPLTSPFLITDTSAVEIHIKNPTTFSLHLEGKVYQFSNIVWLNTSNGFKPVNIEFTVENCLNNCEK